MDSGEGERDSGEGEMDSGEGEMDSGEGGGGVGDRDGNDGIFEPVAFDFTNCDSFSNSWYVTNICSVYVIERCHL
jgi:hypothetical protein